MKKSEKGVGQESGNDDKNFWTVLWINKRKIWKKKLRISLLSVVFKSDS